MKTTLKLITLSLIVTSAPTAFGIWANVSPLFKRSVIGAGILATSALGTATAAKTLRPTPAAPTATPTHATVTATISGTVDLSSAPLHDVRRNSLDFFTAYNNEYAACTQLRAQGELTPHSHNWQTCKNVSKIAAVMMAHTDPRYTDPCSPFFNVRQFNGKNLSINALELSNISTRHPRYRFANHNVRLTNDEDNKHMPMKLLPDDVDQKLFPVKADFKLSASFTEKNVTDSKLKELSQQAQEYGQCMKLNSHELSNNETCKKLGAKPLPNVKFTQFDVTVASENK